MDSIKIKLPIIGKNLKPFIAKINGIYNNIDADLVETTKQIVDLNNQDKLCVFTIFKHLFSSALFFY